MYILKYSYNTLTEAVIESKFYNFPKSSNSASWKLQERLMESPAKIIRLVVTLTPVGTFPTAAALSQLAS